MSHLLDTCFLLLFLSLPTTLQAAEFEQLRVRDDEVPELEKLARKCPILIKGGIENAQGKACILLQASRRGRQHSSDHSAETRRSS